MSYNSRIASSINYIRIILLRKKKIDEENGHLVYYTTQQQQFVPIVQYKKTILSKYHSIL